jgi:cell division protein FtsI (penicillin-binding protein 3)
MPRAPQDRTTGPGARAAADGDRVPSPGQRFPGNARVPGGGPGAARPDLGTRRPRGPSRPPSPGSVRQGGPRRPPRRPRWLAFQRGEPGRRAGITLLAITIVLTLFAGRLVQLQGMESAQLKQAANAEKLTKLTLSAMRGTIYGSNGQILAMTVETYAIAWDPALISDADKPAAAQQLAGPLGVPAAKVLELLRHPTSKEYVLLASDVSAVNEEKIAALNLPGMVPPQSMVPPQPTFTRVYPNGNATANVVGLTSVNPTSGAISGYAGLEEEYNGLLTGTNGSEEVETGLDGQTIPLAGQDDVPAKNGESIKLTINPTLQYEAQLACQQEVTKADAQNCSVVVMEPKTGAILAMAQWLNPADPANKAVPAGTNIAVQNVFAPGSTAKVITASAAFEHSSVTPMTPYNIPYEIYEGGQWIHDAEWSPGEHYTVAGIIANSSNIGMSQVANSVPEPIQYQYLKNFGLDEPTGLNLPGESQGLLPPLSQWAADERYTLAYGQGIDVNAVQMASVYATIANGGVRVRPTLIEGTYNAAGQYVPAAPSPSTRVIQPKTAKELVQILQQVPAVDNEADQRWGDIAGYAIAAKTGTSSEPAPAGEKACPASNPLCVHGSSYIGMAPGNGPQVVVAVNVQDPKTTTDYFGDEVAGPVFYSVMNFALQTLQIQPQPGLVAPYVRLNAS